MNGGTGKTMVLAVCLGVAVSSPAQIYQHVDEHGVVHFSDTAPAAADYQVIDRADLDASTNMMPGLPLPDSTQRRAAKEARAQLRASRTAALRRARHARDVGAVRCDQYRSQLDGIQGRLRAGYRVDEGNRLRAQRRELMAVVARECRAR